MGQPHKSDEMSVEGSPLNGSSVEDCRELYNFGHAPFEVIQKFQDFCMAYSSLSAALVDILKREMLLKRKYIFISSPVMYQMLAKPTQNDSEQVLKNAFEALKRFARKGRYDSVANAIEELLFSPIEASKAFCDKSTWTCGNVGSNYTELSENQQVVLEQIADALIGRLVAVAPEKHRRSKKTTKRNKDRTSPKSKKSKNDETLSEPAIIKLNVNSNEIDDGKDIKLPKTLKSQNNHLCLNTATHSTKVNHLFNAVDADMVIPIQHFVRNNLKKIKLKNRVFDETLEITKSVFCENFLHLLPSEHESKS
ncbi:uncharacterized protein LOC120333914 [Styela clava]|uniref:uncharacterized protein LOC120333914 n=1 Tax=Styela clava TaxID=7725 RepID=UPI00193957F0|nr:uncharacterized protein LOC120333914 [Styela clava]